MKEALQAKQNTRKAIMLDFSDSFVQLLTLIYIYIMYLDISEQKTKPWAKRSAPGLKQDLSG